VPWAWLGWALILQQQRRPSREWPGIVRLGNFISWHNWAVHLQPAFSISWQDLVARLGGSHGTRVCGQCYRRIGIQISEVALLLLLLLLLLLVVVVAAAAGLSRPHIRTDGPAFRDEALPLPACHGVQVQQCHNSPADPAPTS